VRERGGDDEAVAEAFVVLDGLRLNIQPVQLEIYESSSRRCAFPGRTQGPGRLADPCGRPGLAVALPVDSSPGKRSNRRLSLEEVDLCRGGAQVALDTWQLVHDGGESAAGVARVRGLAIRASSA
jgi:hypothetical protein